MSQQDAIKVFKNTKARAIWDGDQEKWYISIVDVVAALAENPAPAAYWRKLLTI